MTGGTDERSVLLPTLSACEICGTRRVWGQVPTMRDVRGTFIGGEIWPYCPTCRIGDTPEEKMAERESRGWRVPPAHIPQPAPPAWWQMVRRFRQWWRA
jgi:hypothetical protein